MVVFAWKKVSFGLKDGQFYGFGLDKYAFKKCITSETINRKFNIRAVLLLLSAAVCGSRFALFQAYFKVKIDLHLAISLNWPVSRPKRLNKKPF